MTAAAAPAEARPATWFQRFVLPGLAFKAVIIGGGYATGRELAEFFLPAGPWGGLAGMVLATLIWSVVAATTFAVARTVHAYDYRSLFAALLGPGWIVFEIAYLLFVVVILAVFGAAAGSIGSATLGLPLLAGTLALAGGIVGFATFGNAAVERLFKYVSLLLYGVYALFLLLAVTRFGAAIARSFAAADAPHDWAIGGVTYAGYNIVGAVVILPVLRHLTRRRDAVVAGLIAGPLAMAPAIVFFAGMAAFYPAIRDATLPSDVMLTALHLPGFRLVFQAMIFAALLESGTGAVHAILERIAAAWAARTGRGLGALPRGVIAAAIVVLCIFVADRFGLVALIARGYRALAVVFLAVYVAPVMTIGVARLLRPASGGR